VTQGATLSFQWYSNTTSSNTGGTAIAGATNIYFVIPTTLTAGTYYYFCEVRASGVNSVRSNVARVTVNAVSAITITTHPAANTTVTQGSIAGSLSVAASVTQGTTLSYQWYSSTTASNTGGNAISSATSSSFTIPTTLAAGNYYYFCEVRGTSANSVRSNVARITVNPITQATSTFAQLLTAINNVAENAQADIIITANIVFTSVITIPSGKDITIKSIKDRHFTFTTVEGCRHFVVKDNAKLTLENITLDGGYAGTGKYRGGINNSGNLALNSGVIIQKCYGDYGGGIYNYFSTLSIVGGKIINNKAEYYGGGFYGYYGTQNVIDSRIADNKAGISGGGVFSVGALNVEGSEFTGNISPSGGGGIWTGFFVITISNTIFSNNVASQAYWMTDSVDIAKYKAQITGVKRFSAPPEGNKPFEYAYNNYDIGYIKGLTENP
jgi:hypothetical protein